MALILDVIASSNFDSDARVTLFEKCHLERMCCIAMMFSSLMGVPKPAWVSLGNVVSHMVPNEDFGRPNRHFRMRFQSTFQGCEYLIWPTLKVL